jgi:hypothetical protein
VLNRKFSSLSSRTKHSRDLSENEKHMKLTKTLFLVILVSILTSFTTQEGFKTVSNQGITILYPSDWEIIKMDGYPILVKEKTKSTEYAVLCNFVVETTNSFKTLEDFIEQYKIKMSTNEYLEDWKIESAKKVEFKGYNGHEFVTTSSAAGYNSKTKVILIQQGDRIINLNTTSSLSDYEKNKVLTDGIFESVVLE